MEQEKEIKKCKGSKNYKKLQTLELRMKGKTLTDISDITGYEKHYISRLIKNYLKNGMEDFLENKYKGNNRKLTKKSSYPTIYLLLNRHGCIKVMPRSKNLNTTSE